MNVYGTTMLEKQVFPGISFSLEKEHGAGMGGGL